MSEPLFFKPASALTVGEIATLTGAEPRPATDLGRRISNVAPLDRAGPGDLTFLDNPKYAGELAATRAVSHRQIVPLINAWIAHAA